MENKKQQDRPDLKSKKRISNREVAALRADWMDELVKGCRTEQDLFGPEGVFTKLKGAVMERLLATEMDQHLGYGPHEMAPGENRRNGYSDKTVETESGPVDIRVPRDREGKFEPRIVPKHKRRLEGFDEKVLALYARGMTTRDISEHLRELYGTEVSHELISQATAGVIEEYRAWQSRPLDSVYPVLYIDAMFVAVKDGAHIKKRPFYVVLGIQTDGKRDVLGLWAAQSEGAKFWLEVLTDLKNRGVQDVFFICADGLAGIGQAISTAFECAVYQTCVVHLIRNAMKFVSWADRKELAAAFRELYTAPNEEAARAALEAVEQRFGQKYPGAIRVWKSRWTDFVPFLAYPLEIRRILYTTNVIESLNSQLRKPLRHRGPFPNDESVFKVFFLAIKNAKTHWKPAPGWLHVLAHFDIVFEGRLPT
jgi:putative transposase